MSTVGYTTTPTNGFTEDASNTGDQVAGKFTMPGAGVITSISCYCATYPGQGAQTGYLCIWSSAGALLTSQSATIPSSPAWVTATLNNNIWLASGTVIYIGWQITGTHGYYCKHDTANNDLTFGHSATIPGALANTSSTSATPGAYATYSPGQAKVWNGTAWVACGVLVWTGSYWQLVAPKVWNGTTWVPGG